MKHAITVRLNDRYEAEKILLDRIDASAPATGQTAGEKKQSACLCSRKACSE